jgi:hypothetical protein
LTVTSGNSPVSAAFQRMTIDPVQKRFLFSSREIVEVARAAGFDGAFNFFEGQLHGLAYLSLPLIFPLA